MTHHIDRQNIIYLYDLPKDTVTSIQIAEAFKKYADVTIQGPGKPQIKRDNTRPFYTAMVKIDDKEKFDLVC
jgi:hypothetical protein